MLIKDVSVTCTSKSNDIMMSLVTYFVTLNVDIITSSINSKVLSSHIKQTNTQMESVR